MTSEAEVEWHRATSCLHSVAYMAGTSVAMPIPSASAGRMNRLPSGGSGSASSSFSQSPGVATSLHGQPFASLFPKPDSQPCEVRLFTGSLIVYFTLAVHVIV